MSTDTENVDERTETSVFETWAEWYHLPILGAVMLFMVWVRTQSYDRFVTGDGSPNLAAIDSWYHWRTLTWTVDNYPHTMPYDVWTGFPNGHYSGQFGTLFDQLVATAAMIVGLGNPSPETVYAVALLAVPVMAALVAIPVFYAGRRLGGTVGGIVSAALLALAPGTFLYRTTAGQLQHHVAEALFMAIAVLAMMVALRVAEREKPIYELVANGDWDAVRRPTIYGALAGVALSLYVWVWPPAVVLIGIFGVFFAVQLCIDYVRGVSPDHVAFVGVVSLTVAALFTGALIEEWSAGVTSFGYLQPLAALLVAAGCLFMAALARQWNARDIDRRFYPVAIGGLIVAGFAAMALVLPGVYDTLVGNLTSRLLPIDPGETTLTIAEAQSPDDFSQHVFDEFGTAFYTMLAGLALLAIQPLLGREYRAEYTLVIVWSLFLTSMAMTQIRFAYYLVLAVAVVNAAFVGELIRLFDFDWRSTSLRELETYQVIVVLLVGVLLFAPLLPPLAPATAMDRGEAASPSHNAIQWEESNAWLGENTPQPGTWGGADNGSELEYYGTYEQPADGDYDYPEGAYGVMSWWDYGHLITVQGERIPHSNPFQQNARSSSAFLTAQSEARAELVLDAIAAGERVQDQSDEELEGAVEDRDGELDEEMRYVMIDHEMAGGKFSAITAWSGPGYGNYYDSREYPIQNESVRLATPNENYYDTTLASLYLQDARGMEHYRLVHEADDYAAVGSVASLTRQGIRGDPHRSFRLGSGWDDETAQQRSTFDQSRMFDRLIPAGQGQFLYDAHVVSSVKTFERVEGATVAGTVDDAAENATAYAQVELETSPGRTFTYTQQADVREDGSFELTVPYATNDELDTDDGYTNSSVEATGEYEVIVGSPGEGGFETQYTGETAVSETAVVEGDGVDVTLEEAEGNESEETPDAETEPDGQQGDETDGDGESAGDENTTGDDNATGDDESTADNETAADDESPSIAPVAVEPIV